MQPIFSFCRPQASLACLTWFFSGLVTRTLFRSGPQLGDWFVRALISQTTWRQAALAAMAALLLVLLTGCGAGRSGSAPQQLDLGAGYAASKVSPVASVRHPPIAVPSGSAASLLTESVVIWRVEDAGQPQAYTTYQWVAPPVTLVTQRIVDRLSLQGPVLRQNAVGDMPQVWLNLQRFEQTFSADGSSSVGQLTLQAIFIKGTKVIEQKLVDIKVPAATQDALGGAQALRDATDQAAEQVAQWLSVQLKR